MPPVSERYVNELGGPKLPSLKAIIQANHLKNFNTGLPDGAK